MAASWRCYVAAACLAAVCGFNVDTRFPLTFPGPSGSYFGFSVALHKNTKGVRALVAAPRANSTFEQRRNLYQPGAVFRCPVNSRKGCEEVPLDKKGNTVSGIPGEERYHKDKKDDGWLGVTLQVQPEGGNVVACGHLWKNQLPDENNSVNYVTNGICYMIDKDLSEASVQTLLPLVNKSRQNELQVFDFAYGMAGFSAAFTQSGSKMYLGAPGVYDYKGTVAAYTTPRNRDVKLSISNTASRLQVEKYSYMGYSTTSGYFTSPDYTLFAAGAPRSGQKGGKVYIAQLVTEERNYPINIRRTVEGEQMGEYFGAAVLGVNLNNDEFTDLLVGAPLHSAACAKCEEEGMVYVYRSTGQKMELQAKLSGRNAWKARFGTTLAALGDINKDDYPDVAVGAPFEGGRGAVYLYHGSKNGIKTKFAQRIEAEAVDPGLSGFGMGISSDVDVDWNDYPDLLIGSFSSDKAVLLRTHPIVEVSARFEFEPRQIIRNVTKCRVKGVPVTCLNVTYCLKNGENFAIRPFDLHIRLEVDTEKKTTDTTRGYFFPNDDPSVIQRTVSIRGDEECGTHQVFLKEDIRDVITPIQFNLSYSVTQEGGQFCSSCPVLNDESPHFVIGQVPFWTGCGQDSICNSDLKLKAHILEYQEGKDLVVEKDKVLTVQVEVENVGEPAYMSEVKIYLPEYVDVKNQGNCHVTTSNTIVLNCILTNPLSNREKDSFQVKLDTSKLPLKKQVVQVALQATTRSQEDNLSDNNVTFNVSFRVQPIIEIIGASDRDQIPFTGEPEDGPIPIVHTFTIKKYTKGDIELVRVEIGVPVKVWGGQEDFLNITGLTTGDPGKVPGNCTLTADQYKVPDDGYISIVGGDLQNVKDDRPKKPFKPWTQKQQIGEMPKDDSAVVDCESLICRKIQCEFGPFQNDVDIATVKISAWINGTLLQDGVGEKEAIGIESQGRAQVDDKTYQNQPLSIRSSVSTAITVLVKPGPPPPEKVKIWIIIVSVIVGILLFAAIFVTLAKLGFFQRFNKEEMEKLQEEKLIENNEAGETKPSPD